MNTRSLKIEIAGDLFRRKTFPKIGVQGRWLATLGFRPGGRVQVTQTGDGVLELRVLRPSSALQSLRDDVCAALQHADARMEAKEL